MPNMAATPAQAAVSPFNRRRCWTMTSCTPGASTITSRSRLVSGFGATARVMGFSGLRFLTRVSAALESVGLTSMADKPPHLLSGGEKRRLALAGVLAMTPTIIAFDEPFASLDNAGIRSIVGEIRRLKQSGFTVVVTTHDLEPVLSLADRLIVMQAGKIVRDGNPNQIAGEVDSFDIRKPCRCSWSGGET